MSRIDTIRGVFESDRDAAIIMTPYNRRYFLGFPSSDGFLVVTRKAAEFIIDSRYIEAAEKEVFPEINVSLQGNNVFEQIKAILDRDGADRVFLERELTLAEYYSYKERLDGIELVTSDVLTKAATGRRSIKEQVELDSIKASQAITDAAFEAILGFIKPGITEVELAARLEYEMRIRGSEGPAFETICITGENTSKPHGVPGNSVIKDGDFITMDYGSLKNGYCSDMTRTVAVGHVTEKQKHVYETVLKAHLESMAAARPGITGAELDWIARKIIYDAGYEGKFGHSLGHSVGLEIHELPGASFRNTEPLPAKTIMTIEPGIYLPGEFGVRIENMIFIDGDGYENLTASPRELIIL